MYLLDTNIISELCKASRADLHVVAWAQQIDPLSMYVSVVSILEIRMGILSLQRKDREQAIILERWLSQQVIPGFADRILSISLPVALRCAELHVPDHRSDRDALIAATALHHGLAVVTRNTKDFLSTGVALHNPWL
jgi:Predicted nucleic acid-binding protein, contains PIN domain